MYVAAPTLCCSSSVIYCTGQLPLHTVQVPTRTWPTCSMVLLISKDDSKESSRSNRGVNGLGAAVSGCMSGLQLSERGLGPSGETVLSLLPAFGRVSGVRERRKWWSLWTLHLCS